ncbi:nose resistant to fluoxetine protein 6-like [Pectinophora gossypiella]|uniref:nose resistant to fluoxetine protein 6-like n=1 Tax=Pectinophora gossypiella TaxID=13191 RepID=UPI00214F4E84|nr:nose resistant to fluoxetine protein 6-like [Pectinophora gossypiella]
MKSINLVLTIFVAHTWTTSYGSLIELNETTFASLPPLYALGDWYQCQHPGDVYCIVDAALTAEGPSPLLHLLQEYSKQTVKHYNRTLIHRGVCVTRCRANETTGASSDSGAYSDSGASSDGGAWRDAAQLCVSESVAKYGLQAQVQSVGWCSVKDAQPPTNSARALAVFCIVIIALVFMATGLHVLCDKCAIIEGNKYLLAFSLKQNWSILTYDRSKPRSDDRMKDVACMEGVRFLGMQCVIFSHVMFICLYSYVDNPQYIEKMYDQFGWQAVLNSPLWLQAFFSLSGFLTAYAVLITTDDNPITLIKCFNSILNRYVRITPLAGFALWFTIAWFPLLGSGPQWTWLVAREAEDCSERWWYHLLYVHNHLPLGKLCMGHTWYLAADMQLHVLGIFTLLFLVRFRRAVIPVLTTLVLASAVAAGVTVYWHQLSPIITAQSPEALRTMFLDSKLMSLVYIPSWMNLSGYVGGIATAFILHHTQVRGIKLSQSKWFTILFHASLTLGGCVVLAGTVFLSDHAPPTWAAPVYAALDRTLVAVFFNIFMLGCVSRCQSAFRTLLDWRGFHTLGRLSYCAFLVHFIVLRLTLATTTQLFHPNLFSLIVLLVTASTLTYAISIPLVLLIELPATQLWRALTQPPRRADRPPPAQRSAPPTPKVFDLVAHIRRRNDV